MQSSFFREVQNHHILYVSRLMECFLCWFCCCACHCKKNKKTLSPLFLFLLFFMLKIQFPVSWRTMECTHDTKCYKHWHREKRASACEQQVALDVVQLLCSISLYMKTVFSRYFRFIRYRVEERSREIELNNKVLELASNNVLWAWSVL